MLENQEWMDDLRAAEVVFVATHSQGCIVSTHLLDRLIRDGHIRTVRNAGALEVAASVSAASVGVPPARPQKICCLALCGIHLGPLRYLNSSTVLQPYFQVTGVPSEGEPVFADVRALIWCSTSNRRRLGSCSNFRYVGVSLGLSHLTACPPTVKNTESQVSIAYAKALKNIVDNGVGRVLFVKPGVLS
jgi:hypothetical protein